MTDGLPSSDRTRLEHLLDAIARIGRYVEIGRDSLDDDMTRDAVLRCLTIVGDALGAPTADTYRQLPSLPPHLPRGQRNMLVHEYWRVDADIVWNTIVRDLPPLADDIRAIL